MKIPEVILQVLNGCQADHCIKPPKGFKKMMIFCITDHEGCIGVFLMIGGMMDDFLIIVYTDDFTKG